MSLPSPFVQPPHVEIVPSREPEQRDVAPTTFVGAVEPLPATTAQERSWEEMYTRRFVPMHHACNRLLADADAAKDVVHDTMIQFLKKWDALPLEQRTDAYMMQAARRRALAVLKQRKGRVEYTRELEESGEVPVVELTGDVSDLVAAANRVIAQMPARCREIMVLVHDYEMSQKDAAVELGISYETARSHYKRAIRILRKSLVKRPDLVAGASQALLGSGDGRNDHE